jgi:hypothetical protein
MAASFPIFMPDVPAAGKIAVIHLNSVPRLDIHPIFEGRRLRVEGMFPHSHIFQDNLIAVYESSRTPRRQIVTK